MPNARKLEDLNNDVLILGKRWKNGRIIGMFPIWRAFSQTKDFSSLTSMQCSIESGSVPGQVSGELLSATELLVQEKHCSIFLRGVDTRKTTSIHPNEYHPNTSLSTGNHSHAGIEMPFVKFHTCELPKSPLVTRYLNMRPGGCIICIHGTP